MGIFGTKKDKSKTISLPNNMEQTLVQPASADMLDIKLGDKIIVEQGWWAVIVINDKPIDVFDVGEWEMTLPNLPNTNKLLKLDRSHIAKEGGKEQMVFSDTFKCDVYYVSQQLFASQTWRTRLVHQKSTNKKRFDISMSGTCDYRVTDPKALIRLFLLEWAKIAYGRAGIRLSKYINEFVDESVEWYKCATPAEMDDENKMAEVLRKNLGKNLNKYGINFVNFRVDKIDFSQDVFDEITLARLAKQQNKPTEETAGKADASEVEQVVLVQSGSKLKAEASNTAQTNVSTNTEIVVDTTQNTKEQKSNQTDLPSVVLDKKSKGKGLSKKQKQCPNCKKIHNIDVDVCDCGCNLD